MKKFLVLLTFFCLFACGSQQDQNESDVIGVKFQQKSIDEIVALARADQKLIMIDTYSDG
jgi:ABC-type proline/glycine betaine transport system substrate-binding protein